MIEKMKKWFSRHKPRPLEHPEHRAPEGARRSVAAMQVVVLAANLADITDKVLTMINKR